MEKIEQQKYRDQYYGNELYKKGKYWYIRYSSRSPLFTNPDPSGKFTYYQKLNAQDSKHIDFLVQIGKISKI